MPLFPWTTATQPGQQTEALVLGSRLILRSRRHTLSFLRAAMRIRRQVMRSPGALGVSLIAKPAAKTYWTLSAWADQEALDTFVRTSPHTEVMKQFHDRMTSSSFTTWNAPTAELPKPRSNAKQLWHEAKERLTAQANIPNQ